MGEIWVHEKWPKSSQLSGWCPHPRSIRFHLQAFDMEATLLQALETFIHLHFSMQSREKYEAEERRLSSSRHRRCQRDHQDGEVAGDQF